MPSPRDFRVSVKTGCCAVKNFHDHRKVSQSPKLPRVERRETSSGSSHSFHRNRWRSLPRGLEEVAWGRSSAVMAYQERYGQWPRRVLDRLDSCSCNCLGIPVCVRRGWGSRRRRSIIAKIPHSVPRVYAVPSTNRRHLRHDGSRGAHGFVSRSEIKLQDGRAFAITARWVSSEFQVESDFWGCMDLPWIRVWNSR